MTLKSTRQRLIYVASDYVMLLVGWTVFSVLRYRLMPGPSAETPELIQFLMHPGVIGGALLYPLVIIGLYWLSGYYNYVFFKSRLQDLGNTALISLFGTLIIYFVALINDNTPERMLNYELLAVLWGCLFVPVLAVRMIITGRTSYLIKSHRLEFNTLMIGATRGAVKLAEKISKRARGMGFRIIGYVDTGSGDNTHTGLDLPVYNIDDLDNVCRQHKVTRLIVAPHRHGFRETGELINRLFPLDLPIYITPDLYGLIISKPRIADVAGEPLIDISRTHASASTINCKRLSDVVLSALALVVLSPVFAILAAAIRLDSHGPVFYKQERIGFHKRPFNIYKFRTMTVDAEANGPTLSTLDDPRITRLGHYMRKYRLDEMPQFWNVLKGDMSLVGPRPEREFYIRQIVARAPYYNLIHQVRPGITSWGMVKFGYASSVDQMIERLRYDLLYIDNISLSVDLKIIIYTVNTVLTGKGV